MLSGEMLNSILSSNTEESREAVIAYTRFLITERLSSSNASIYLKILQKNIKESADIIFKNRTPELLFSSIKITRELITSGIRILSDYKAKELYMPILLSLLSILKKGYHNPSVGLSVYKLSVSDLHHIGKYLISNEPRISDMIQDILEALACTGEDKTLSICAKGILNSILDNSKKLSDVIPGVLLV